MLFRSPQGGATQFGTNNVNYNYSLPVNASWQIDIFGKLRNAKEYSKVLLENSYTYKKAVKCELISSIASQYYTLAMLNEQKNIVLSSEKLWQETITTLNLLMEAGQYSIAAVSQAQANYNGVVSSLLDIEQQIKEVENSLNVTLNDTLKPIEAKSINDWENPTILDKGVPLNFISMRPDIEKAELDLASAFYLTAQARSNFYPSLVLSGSVGWSNFAGAITNPGKLIWDAIASITQPIFENGKIKAQYRISKLQQEEAKLNMQNTILRAGAEVNTLYSKVESLNEKSNFIAKQIKDLETTLEATKLLMEGGSSNYLEILTAQDALLGAQLSFIVNKYNIINSYISLYQSLGGGIN